MHACHVGCEALGPVDVRPHPFGVEGLEEQFEPALEVLRGERVLRVYSLVRGKRIPRVSGLVEQGPAPERGELGEMFRPVDAREHR